MHNLAPKQALNLFGLVHFGQNRMSLFQEINRGEVLNTYWEKNAPSKLNTPYFSQREDSNRALRNKHDQRLHSLSLSLTVRGVRASFCVHLDYFLPRSCQRHRSSTSELKGFPINFSLAPSHGRTKSLSSSEFRMSEFTAHPVATSEVTPSLSTMTNTCILSLSLSKCELPASF